MELRGQGVKGIGLLTARGTPAEAFYLRSGFGSEDRMVFMGCGI